MSGSSYLTTASCIVFVGNIPYGLSETQITEIFSSVGRVVCFRMVFDRDTGRSKGYGFAEYIDAETAASAVRNLDNYEVMGRKLRVDYSSQGYVGKELGFQKEGLFSQSSFGKDSQLQKNDLNYSDDSTVVDFSDVGYLNISNGGEGGHSSHVAHYEVPTQITGTATGVQTTINPYPNHTNTNFVNQNHQNQSRTNSNLGNVNNSDGESCLLPQLPVGPDILPGLTAADSISKTLAAIPVSQLLRALTQMKELVITDPARATELLYQAPQLSYALFQSLIMMNLVEPGVLAQLLDSNKTAGIYTQATMSIQHTQHQTGSINPIMVSHSQSTQLHATPIPAHAPQTMPTTIQPQPPSFYGYPATAQPRSVHTHSATHGGHGQEIFMSQPGHNQQTRVQAGMEPDKAMLLQRVMVLSPEEISRLPAEQQQQILLLKHRLITEGMGTPSLQTGY